MKHHYNVDADGSEMAQGEHLQPIAPSRGGVSVDGGGESVDEMSAQEQTSSALVAPDGNLKKHQKVAGTASDNTAAAAGAILLHPVDVSRFILCIVSPAKHLYERSTQYAILSPIRLQP